MVKSSGFHLKFMQALLRIRWESDGTNLKYNIRGYIRAMQWRLLVGVAHALISQMIVMKDHGCKKKHVSSDATGSETTVTQNALDRFAVCTANATDHFIDS